jgi:hypothetical protein
MELTVFWSATDKPLDILKGSNLFLTPVQGLLGIALGFFLHTTKGEERETFSLQRRKAEIGQKAKGIRQLNERVGRDSRMLGIRWGCSGHGQKIEQNPT